MNVVERRLHEILDILLNKRPLTIQETMELRESHKAIVKRQERLDKVLGLMTVARIGRDWSWFGELAKEYEKLSGVKEDEILFAFDEERFKEIVRSVVREEISNALKDIEVKNLPPLMSQTEVMKFLGIGRNKACELFNRKDFPVTTEFGHKKVVTAHLIEWIHSHSEWMNENRKGA